MYVLLSLVALCILVYCIAALISPEQIQYHTTRYLKEVSPQAFGSRPLLVTEAGFRGLVTFRILATTGNASMLKPAIYFLDPHVNVFQLSPFHAREFKRYILTKKIDTIFVVGDRSMALTRKSLLIDKPLPVKVYERKHLPLKNLGLVSLLAIRIYQAIRATHLVTRKLVPHRTPAQETPSVLIFTANVFSWWNLLRDSFHWNMEEWLEYGGWTLLFFSEHLWVDIWAEVTEL
ncbi:hypothetical protein VNI00_018540 [Paramarasmius palmivorus]|uniref:Uncharacterized protein n=1 Tax=Paramarasmius palmivorus TaxID=297713 RepID=A0AAW0AYS8_9AGAR